MICGILLIIVGIVIFFQQYYKISIDLWPVILIFIGILIIAGGLYRSSRR